MPEIDMSSCPCCGCCTRKPASLFINLDSVIDDAPATCNGGVVDAGLNWELPYDAVNDWWYGTEPNSGFGYRVRCAADNQEPPVCHWYGQPFCNNEEANSESELIVHSENPIDLSSDGTTWGNDIACQCVIEGQTTSVLPSFIVSITE